MDGKNKYDSHLGNSMTSTHVKKKASKKDEVDWDLVQQFKDGINAVKEDRVRRVA